MGYIAVVLDEPSRARLLETFPTSHPDVICHHITLAFGMPETALDDFRLAYRSATFGVIGVARNDKVEALIVSNGLSTARSDGKTLHITHSIDRAKGGKPVQSNNLVSNQANWMNIKRPAVPVTGTIQYFN